MITPDSAPDCIHCLTHLVQWQKQMEENEDLQQRFERLIYKIKKLSSTRRKLRRSLAIAHELLDRQEALIETLANN